MRAESRLVGRRELAGYIPGTFYPLVGCLRKGGVGAESGAILIAKYIKWATKSPAGDDFLGEVRVLTTPNLVAMCTGEK